MEIVGFFKFPPHFFYMHEPVELLKILDKARERDKYEHELMYLATRNAVGQFLSKKYKYFDYFKQSKKREVTEDERQKMKEYLESW